MLQALILGSSNNHADTLARWAYGSVSAYLEAANAGSPATAWPAPHVADTTGLDAASAGTATDLARLAGIAASHPVIAEFIATPASALADRRGVENTTAYLPEQGITGISRSYTDAGGVCFLFTAEVRAGESTFTFAGAFIGEPDYDTLTADLTALMTSAVAGVAELPVLAEGDAYVRFTAPWGDTASGVVRVSKTRVAWQATAPDATVKLDSFSTGRAGKLVGRVSSDAAGEDVVTPGARPGDRRSGPRLAAAAPGPGDHRAARVAAVAAHGRPPTAQMVSSVDSNGSLSPASNGTERGVGPGRRACRPRHTRTTIPCRRRRRAC